MSDCCKAALAAALAVLAMLAVAAQANAVLAVAAQANAVLAGAAQANAVLAGAAQARSFGGVVPDVPTRMQIRRALLAHTANVPYGGGEVLHWNRTHLIFWQPAGSSLTFDPGYVPLIETFLQQVAADSHMTSSMYGLSGQYTDANGPAAYASVYGGATIATDPLPANGCTEPPQAGPGWTVCLTDQQLETEIKHVISADHLPRGANDIYFLVTPNGLGDCELFGPTDCALGGQTDGSYCGYHSSTSDGILYAVIPYNAVPGHCQSDNPRPNSSTADPAISTVSHEQIETVTDPLGDAWLDAAGNEIADLCITSYGAALGGTGTGAWDDVIDGGHYYLQEIWSNTASSCQPRAKPDAVFFSAPRRAVRGRPVSLSARATDPEGRIVSYDWFFGDGRTGRDHRASHSFERDGVYRIVVRTTDSWGNWGFFARQIRISGR